MNNKKGKNISNILLSLIYILLVSLVFLVGWSLGILFMSEVGVVKDKEEITCKNYVTTVSNSFKLVNLEEVVIENAIYNFYNSTGEIPNDLNELSPVYLSDKFIKTSYTPYSKVDSFGNGIMQIITQSVGDKNTFLKMRVIVNLTDNKMYLTAGEFILKVFDVATGKNDLTPTGILYVNDRISNPMPNWDTDENPYGNYLIELSDEKYAIHGTNNEELIGQYVSNGCIRMKNEDIELLYMLIGKGSTIIIVDDFQEDLYTNLSESFNGTFSSLLSRSEGIKEVSLPTYGNWSN